MTAACPLELGVGFPWLGILDGPAPAVPEQPAPRERWRYLYRTDGWTGPLDVWALVANPGPGRQVGNLVAVSVPA